LFKQKFYKENWYVRFC